MACLGAAGLAWLCAAALGLAALEAASDAPPPPSAVAASVQPAPRVSAPPAPTSPAPEPADTESATEASAPAPAAPAFVLPAAPPSPLDNPSLDNAFDEPLMHELVALIDALLYDAAPGSVNTPAQLTAYATDLMRRLNAHDRTYRVTIHDHALEQARRRVQRLHTTLVRYGLDPALLITDAQSGRTQVSVQPL